MNKLQNMLLLVSSLASYHRETGVKAELISYLDEIYGVTNHCSLNGNLVHNNQLLTDKAFKVNKAYSDAVTSSDPVWMWVDLKARRELVSIWFSSNNAYMLASGAKIFVSDSAVGDPEDKGTLC